MSTAVVGRATELEAIERFLGALAGGPAALVLAGEPGIGKTTLLRATIEAAQRRGARVLSCAPSAPETRLSYAALADLLAGIDDDVVEALPAPQRDALDAALLRSHPGVNVDPRAIATAVLSVLERLAEDQPVLAAIDDVQWLDRPSARVVEFCARRLAGRIGLIVSRRVGEEAAWARRLIELRDPDRVAIRELEPFSVAELGLVMHECAQTRLPRRALVRVHEVSGGNPFYALELARSLPADGPLPAALALPASLDEIVAARLAGLGEEVEEALLAVAALADPTIDLLGRALGPGVASLLERAEARGMIELHGRHVRFTHPLLSNGIYARAASGRRRTMHRRLSEVVSDAEERARHLAYALVMPDALAALEEAARYVRSRGAPDTAAELLELALGLGGKPSLRVQAAEHHFDAGDPQRAQALLADAIEALPSGETRAEALVLLGEIRYHDDSYSEARTLFERARAEHGEDDRLAVMIDGRLAFMLFNQGQFAESSAAASSALTVAERLGNPALLAQALAASVITDFGLGLGLDEERLSRALELEDPDLRTSGELRPSHIAPFLYRWTGRLDESRALLAALARELAERGEEHDLAWLGFWRVSLECLRGDLPSAAALGDESVDRLLRLETPHGRALALALRAVIDAYAGNVDETRRAAEDAIALSERARWQLLSNWSRAALGFLELSVGDHDAAGAALAPLAAVASSASLPEPTTGDMFFHGDVAEALVATGRSEEAETIAAWLEERGRALDRTWAIAVGARCRGLILAARGDAIAAEEALERALVAHGRLPMPIEHARSLLVLGRVRRRLKKRRAAKAVLDQALEIFETVGSPRWAEQTHAEIACLGLRPGAQNGLTPSEERVARLAATGLTNREVARSLNVSSKTVEAQLARAYRKLGIRSRAELGTRFAQRDAAAKL